MKLPVPVNIITGGLGAGKTTAIAHLLRCKPQGERWALLVNEFGALGIDAALLEAAAADGAHAATAPREAGGGGDDAAPTASGSSTTGGGDVSGGGGDGGDSTSGRSGGGGGRSGGDGGDGSGSGGSRGGFTPYGPRPPPDGGGGSALEGLVVRELAGGCLCCSLSGPLGAAIAQLVRQAKPDRLLIEPSGLGHPAGLLDVLHGEHLRPALALRAVVCLVDVSRLRVGAAGPEGEAGAAEDVEGGETFQDQVNVADVLVGSKADAAGAQQVAAFEAWAARLYPPKLRVLTSSRGRLDAGVLDLPRSPTFRSLFSPHASRRAAAQRGAPRATAAPAVAAAAAAATGGPAAVAAADAATGSLQSLALDAAAVEGPPLAALPRQPLRFPSSSSPAAEPASRGAPAAEGEPAQASCGWLFSADDVFDRPQLSAVLQQMYGFAPARLKGIFRVGARSYVVPYFDAARGRLELQPIAYRRESRVEVIVERGGRGAVAGGAAGGGDEAGSADALGIALAAGDWDTVERALLGALAQGP